MEQVIANGLYLGAQYALIALGLTLIFGLMNVLNFAHGQMYVLGGFVTYTVYGQLGLPFIVALIASALTLAIVGALIERYLFRTVIKRSVREESTMLLAAGIAFFLDAIILLLFGEKQRGVPKIVDGVFNWDFRLIMLTIGAIVAAVSGLLLLTNVIADIGGLAGIVAPLFLYSGTLNLIGANSMERPRPVPSPTDLVVKNGSKARSAIDGGIPVPVSDTDRTT